MTANVLCRLTFSRPAPLTLHGSYAGGIVSDEYWGDFNIRHVNHLEWTLRRPRGSRAADLELVIDDEGGRFQRLIDAQVWALARCEVWVGNGTDFDAGYAKKDNATSPGALWSGRLFEEGGIVRQSGDEVLLRASNNPFLYDPGVLQNDPNAFVGAADGYDRWIPLVFGDWTTSVPTPRHAVPALLTGYGSSGSGGDWSVCIGPVESLRRYFKEGPDPAHRDDSSFDDRLNIISYVTGVDLGSGRYPLAHFSLDGTTGTPPALLGYTPPGVWIEMKGLKTTASTPLPGLANEFIDRARDMAQWLILYRLNVAAAEVDTASFGALDNYKGRRGFFTQRFLQPVLEELEHDLGFQSVFLSGARGAGATTAKLVAVKLGQGRILSDWIASRFLIGGSIEGRIERMGYENIDVAYYGYSAQAAQGFTAAIGLSIQLDSPEIRRVGFGFSAPRFFRWLYTAADVQAVQQRYLAHFGDWPLEAVQFHTTLDYLDVLPTDRLILEPDKDVTSGGTRYTHVTNVTLDWPRQLFRIEGYKANTLAPAADSD